MRTRSEASRRQSHTPLTSRPGGSFGPESHKVKAFGITVASRRPGWLSNSYYIRTQSGFEVRYTSSPGTKERDSEEDTARGRLQGLSLNPR